MFTERLGTLDYVVIVAATVALILLAAQVFGGDVHDLE